MRVRINTNAIPCNLKQKLKKLEANKINKPTKVLKLKFNGTGLVNVNMLTFTGNCVTVIM